MYKYKLQCSGINHNVQIEIIMYRYKLECTGINHNVQVEIGIYRYLSVFIGRNQNFDFYLYILISTINTDLYL